MELLTTPEHTLTGTATEHRIDDITGRLSLRHAAISKREMDKIRTILGPKLAFGNRTIFQKKQTSMSNLDLKIR